MPHRYALATTNKGGTLSSARVGSLIGAGLAVAMLVVAAVPSAARGERISYRISGRFLPGPVDPLGVAGGTFALDLHYESSAPPIEGTNEFALYESIGGFLILFDTPVDGVHQASSRAGVTEAATDSLLFQVRPSVNGQVIVSQLGFIFAGNAVVAGTPPALPTSWPPNSPTALTSFLLGPEIADVLIDVVLLPERIAGDADGDGNVGAGDYALWAAQFGQTGSGLSADFNYDGSVGAADYTLWAANFGETLGGGGSGGGGGAGMPVPEPSAAALLLLGLAGGSLAAARRSVVLGRRASPGP